MVIYNQLEEAKRTTCGPVGRPESEMTKQDIAAMIKKETGLSVSIKSGTGSMKGYTFFTVRNVGRTFPTWSIEFARKMKDAFPAEQGTFCSTHRLSVFGI